MQGNYSHKQFAQGDKHHLKGQVHQLLAQVHSSLNSRDKSQGPHFSTSVYMWWLLYEQILLMYGCSCILVPCLKFVHKTMLFIFRYVRKLEMLAHGLIESVR